MDTDTDIPAAKRRKLADDIEEEDTSWRLIKDVWSLLMARYLPLGLLLRMIFCLSRDTLFYMLVQKPAFLTAMKQDLHDGFPSTSYPRPDVLMRCWRSYAYQLTLTPERDTFLFQGWPAEPVGSTRLEKLHLSGALVQWITTPFYDHLPRWTHLRHVHIATYQFNVYQLREMLEKLFALVPRLEMLSLFRPRDWLDVAMYPTPIALPAISGPAFFVHCNEVFTGFELAVPGNTWARNAEATPYWRCCPELVVRDACSNVLSLSQGRDMTLWSQRSPRFKHAVLSRFMTTTTGTQHPLFREFALACLPVKDPSQWSAKRWIKLIERSSGDVASLDLFRGLVNASDDLLRRVAVGMRTHFYHTRRASFLWDLRKEMPMVQRLFNHVFDPRRLHIFADPGFRSAYWSIVFQTCLCPSEGTVDLDPEFYRGVSQEGIHPLPHAMTRHDRSPMVCRKKHGIPEILKIWPDAGERVYRLHCAYHLERGPFQASFLQLGLLLMTEKDQERWMFQSIHRGVCDWLVTCDGNKTTVPDALKKKARTRAGRPAVVAAAREALQTQNHACIPSASDRNGCTYY